MGFSSLRYSGAVKSARPSIASANRPRLGQFTSLLDQILHDNSALDAFAYAYAELPSAERPALIRAILQDAGNPTQALMALLAVEEDPSSQHRLAGLISRHGHIEQSAFLAGSEEEGEAYLRHSLPGAEHESLCLTWKDREIQRIEIESQNDLKFSLPAVEVSIAVETLAPLLWRRIRSGAALPEGVERFAGFFSAS